jgi:hypothetical protein
MRRSPFCRICALVAVILSPLLTGCATTRTVTIRTTPPDAIIRIDGVERSRGQIREKFVFERAGQTHRVVATRKGYYDESKIITRDSVETDLLLELRPETWRISIIPNVAARISINGKPVSPDLLSSYSTELVMGFDERDVPVSYTISAERENYEPVTRTVTRNDPEWAYGAFHLKLPFLKKRLAIRSDPPGAEIFVDQRRLGTTPIVDVPVEFPVDANDQFIPLKLRAEKAGYEPGEIEIAWDSGKTEYQVNPKIFEKEVSFITTPPGATVTMDGKELPRDENGMSRTTLRFPPINERGDLPTYAARITLTAEDSEWNPASVQIAYDNGRRRYEVQLKEILTRQVQMLTPLMRRIDGMWEMAPEWEPTLAMKNTDEGPTRKTPQSVVQLAKGAQLGSLAVSPDGARVLYSLLWVNDQNQFRSRLVQISSDGKSGSTDLSDGTSLDLMPCYTPSGERIGFSSNRHGRRMNIYSMSTFGIPGIREETRGDMNELWPSFDSDAQQRLFYQAMIDTRPDARLYMMEIGTVTRTELNQNISGMQPRVSPRNNSIVFSVHNPGNDNRRDVYKMTDRGESPENLTNSPDADEFDPSWSRDGSRIVFASNKGSDDAVGQNYDIWMMDLSKPNEPPVQITVNGSHDDSPMFDPSGTAVYFRSNRGGAWGIWKMPLK